MSFEETPQKLKQFFVSFIYSLISLQAAWSTIMAEEVVANIRTVRAFGMEYHECEKFEKEVQKTAKLFKKLGFGIALFQVYIISCARSFQGCASLSKLQRKNEQILLSQDTSSHR